MSRWFPEHLELRFGDAPSLASSSSHGAPAALAGQVVAGKLDAALIAFERELDALELPRGTRLTCVLAGEGVRYRVVPWRDDLASPTQRQLLATQCFAEAYGDAARSWTIRQNTGGHGAATLACAVDSTLLDRIDAMTQARGLRLVSVQPSLMHAFNRVRGRIEADLFWFVCIEGPWTTLLLTTRDEPRHVKVLPSAVASGDLSRLLDREWFALGVDTPRCPVVVSRLLDGGDASSGLAPTLVKGWQVIDLDAAVERRGFVHPASSVAASAVVASPAASPASTSVAPSIAKPASATAEAPSVVTAAGISVDIPQAAPTTSAPRSVPPLSPALVSQPSAVPAPMSASIHATMPAPQIAKPFVSTAAEPRPQPAPVATSAAAPTATSASTPAVIEPAAPHSREPESVSVVAIPQFEWWSATAGIPPAPTPVPAPVPVPAAAPAPAPAAMAVVVAPMASAPAQAASIGASPTVPAPTSRVPAAASAAAPGLAAPVPAARRAAVMPPPAATAAPAAEAMHAGRARALPFVEAPPNASVPVQTAMARRPAVDRAAETATRTAADPAPSADGDGDEARPGKWASFFRRRPKSPDATKPSTPPEGDLPVPRWVNGRWESS